MVSESISQRLQILRGHWNWDFQILLYVIACLGFVRNSGVDAVAKFMSPEMTHFLSSLLSQTPWVHLPQSMQLWSSPTRRMCIFRPTSSVSPSWPVSPAAFIVPCPRFWGLEFTAWTNAVILYRRLSSYAWGGGAWVCWLAHRLFPSFPFGIWHPSSRAWRRYYGCLLVRQRSRTVTSQWLILPWMYSLLLRFLFTFRFEINYLLWFFFFLSK